MGEVGVCGWCGCVWMCECVVCKHGTYALLTAGRSGQGGSDDHLTERDWLLLLTNSKNLIYWKDDVILEEGTFNKHLFRVKNGRVRIEKKYAHYTHRHRTQTTDRDTQTHTHRHTTGTQRQA